MPTNSNTATAPSPQLATRAEPAPHRCGCGHLDQTHDHIAARYCAATQTGALTRGCICHAGPMTRSP
jgi:hypothetical protein